MRFLNKTRLVLLLIFGTNNLIFEVSAQDSENIDLDLVYNEWALSKSESYDDILVYRDEDDFIFDGIPYNTSKNLKFTRYEKTLYLRYPKWNRRPVRCGNGLKYSSSKKDEGWRKGVWNIEQEGDYTFLILEYFKAKKDGKYVRTDMFDYQILILSEDKMVLQQLTKKSIN